MSEEMATSTEANEVFVRLVGEGTIVFRPAPAFRQDGFTFTVSAPAEYDPEDKTWEFPPGSVVECRRQVVGDCEGFVAFRLATRVKSSAS